jgi:hypothetical protein
MTCSMRLRLLRIRSLTVSAFALACDVATLSTIVTSALKIRVTAQGTSCCVSTRAHLVTADKLFSQQSPLRGRRSTARWP